MAWTFDNARDGFMTGRKQPLVERDDMRTA
jgi:hypothetical protein